MFEKLSTPEEIFSFKLGSLLTAERDTLDQLGTLEEAALRPELKALLREHAAETRQQISNVEQCFQLLGEDVDDSPSPVTKGMAKEGSATLRKTAPELVDAVILVGALETEHYEIAVYEALITNADARGALDVKALLEANLAQEESARDKIKAMAWEVSHAGIAYTPGQGAAGAPAGGAASGRTTVVAEASPAGRSGGSPLAEVAQEGSPIVTDR